MFLDLFAEIKDVSDRATALVVLRFFERLRRVVARPLDQWPPYERLASQCRDQAELEYVALFDDLRRAICPGSRPATGERDRPGRPYRTDARPLGGHEF
jgi:hypothetical protein